ncbi:uncharacterized protein LOC124941538 [Impatiens glandulifera]|uniref:uncharacterized protein LOC124941538 n=1 Tax=Impatiens glandulifera TaxID=253017 RepID=UPI001FB0A511|nr:uncharacterized protein LOC124941538 [Impatiens glandulifera]
MTLEVMCNDGPTWVFDIACDVHIISNVKGLRNRRQVKKGKIDLRVGNGANVDALAVGVYSLSLPSGYSKGSFGYYFYNPNEQKVFVAKDNVFLEREFLSNKSRPHIIQEPEQEDLQIVVDHIPDSVVEQVELNRRSERQKVMHGRYNDFILNVSLDVLMLEHNEPSTYNQALIGPDSNKWLKAMSKTQCPSTPAELEKMTKISYVSAIGSIIAVSWKSFKQDTVANSTTEAEYIAASEAAKEAVWIRKFLDELGVVHSISRPINIYCDNNGGIAQAKEPSSSSKSRHVMRKYHLICHIINMGDIRMCKVHTDNNIANPLTKHMSTPKHESHTRAKGLKHIGEWL